MCVGSSRHTMPSSRMIRTDRDVRADSRRLHGQGAPGDADVGCSHVYRSSVDEPYCSEAPRLTPLAVIDRYLDAASADPLDREGFLAVLGLDADLLGRWTALL